MLYTFKPNKSCAYLLNVGPSNIVFLKTYNPDFDNIIIIFTDKNGRSLEREDEVNFTLFINKHRDDTIFYRTENKKIC